MRFRQAIFIWFVFAQFVFRSHKNVDNRKLKAWFFRLWKNDFCRLYKERARALQSWITFFVHPVYFYMFACWPYTMSTQLYSPHFCGETKMVKFYSLYIGYSKDNNIKRSSLTSSLTQWWHWDNQYTFQTVVLVLFTNTPILFL